ncbi:hypothetical protein [Oecophyllibacter saccharovorans]|uniref:hypothetical protein n=1 Tax=Oecophyllibacter saccharovorans TaxID=2558360 RepID=UPI0013F4BFF6|nr:hypothetical protein [Oecophyllibacter saccharovorans]
MRRPTFEWNPDRLSDPDKVPIITKRDLIGIQIGMALFILLVHLYLVFLPVQ